MPTAPPSTPRTSKPSLRLYAADVRVFDMWGCWSYDGLEAWRSMAAGWFGSLGTERVGVDFHDVQGHGIARARRDAPASSPTPGLAAEGQALRSLQSRHTWMLRPDAGDWKIVHEHSSGPADFDTGKGDAQALTRSRPRGPGLR